MDMNQGVGQTVFKAMNCLTITQIVLLGGILRFVMIYVGVVIDSYSVGGLSYTDIDYKIFSDAADFIRQGQSPYERATYRYPPFVATLLTLNGFLPEFGKILFSLADTAIIYEMHRNLELIAPHFPHTKLICLAWCFNLASINICTRGSADSITNYIVLLLLRLAMDKQAQYAGVCMGIAIHLRIYPLIFFPAIFFYFSQCSSPPSTIVMQTEGEIETTHNGDDGADSSSNSFLKNSKEDNAKVVVNHSDDHHNTSSSMHCNLERFLNYHQLRFGMFSAASFMCATLFSYALYGEHFWQQAVWYHVGREDHRHNFSVHFYWIYLKKALTQVLLSVSSSPSSITAASPVNSNTSGISLMRVTRAICDFWLLGAEESCSSIGSIGSSDGGGLVSTSSISIFNYYLSAVNCNVCSSLFSLAVRNTTATATDSSSSDSSYTYASFVAGVCWSMLHASLSLVERVWLSLPQFALLGSITAAHARDSLPVCFLLLTAVFVTYNKVITAQYFTWYLCILPVCVPYLTSVPQRTLSAVLAVWVGSIALWLYFGYQLEFNSANVFLYLWLASLTFHATSVTCIAVISRYCRKPPLYPQRTGACDVYC